MVVDPSSVDAKEFMADLDKVRGPDTPVEFANSMVARVFMNSDKANREFKEYSQPLRKGRPCCVVFWGCMCMCVVTLCRGLLSVMFLLMCVRLVLQSSWLV